MDTNKELLGLIALIILLLSLPSIVLHM